MPSSTSLVSLKGTVSGVGRICPCSKAIPIKTIGILQWAYWNCEWDAQLCISSEVAMLCHCFHHMHFYHLLTTITIIPTCAPTNRHFPTFFLLLFSYKKDAWWIVVRVMVVMVVMCHESIKRRVGGKLPQNSKCMGQWQNVVSGGSSLLCLETWTEMWGNNWWMLH
jgi:hypothetical protein